MKDFYSEKAVKGRRGYKCQFCTSAIEKGSLHVCVSSCSAGDFHTHRAHLACHELATSQPAPAHASASRDLASV